VLASAGTAAKAPLSRGIGCHGTLVGSTAVVEPALALVPNGIDDGRSVPSNKAWASAEPVTVTVAARL